MIDVNIGRVRREFIQDIKTAVEGYYDKIEELGLDWDEHKYYLCVDPLDDISSRVLMNEFPE